MDFDLPGTALALTPVAVFVGAMAGELSAPLRRPRADTTRRRIANAALFAGGAVVLAALGGMAWDPALSWPRDAAGWAGFVAGLALLDLGSYLIHRLQHAVPALWRFHAVHHSDVDVDSTTALRHHPGEAVLNYAALALPAWFLGMPEATLAAYGALALAVQIVQHANLGGGAIGARLAAALIITPATHRIHHSRDAVDGNRNFGTILAVWDRVFGTYRAPQAAADAAIDFGLDGRDGPRHQRPDWIFLIPFLPAERRG